MRSAPHSRGFSLMEVTVVTAIVAVILIMAYEIIESAARTAMFVEVRNDLPVMAQAAANDVQAELFQSRVIFDADPAGIGPGYVGALRLPPAYPLLQDSQLPLMNPNGDLVPDAGTRYTGNCLLLARQLPPVSVSMGGGQRLLADVYQFELIYLTRRGGRAFSTSPYFVDLIRAKSWKVADYFQLSNLPTQQAQAAANSDLLAYVDPATNKATAIDLAWDPGQAIGNAFYTVKASGAYTPIAKPTIDLTYSSGTMLKGLSGGRISAAGEYTVGFRPSGTTAFGVRDAVPKYAAFNASTPLFPSGAEFLIVGPAGQRRALSRVVLFANYGVGKLTSKEVEVITAAR